MKQSIRLLTCAAILLFAASCEKTNADGPTISQNRNHSGFTAISSGVDATVIFSQSSAYKVEIRAQQALLDEIKSEVQGGELRFYYPGRTNIGRHDPITIYVSGPDVTGFTLNGSGDLHGGELLAGNKNVHLKCNGSGSVNFSSVTAGSVDAEVVGSGNMSISAGTVSNASCEISGSGGINFNNLHASDVTTHTSGSGTTRVWADHTLDAHISGSGHVYYRGNPRVTSNISGSGSVRAN